MGNGIPILGTVTKKCKVEKINDFTFKIILVQGLNRQIRRMCEYLGYEVTKLKRIRIMNISLDIPVGKWRDISPEELKEKVSNISGEKWKEMSKACYEWYQRNVHSDNCWGNMVSTILT